MLKIQISRQRAFNVDKETIVLFCFNFIKYTKKATCCILYKNNKKESWHINCIKTIRQLTYKELQAMSKNHPDYISTTNACKLCKPLGACLAFKGIEGTVPYLHGSQGCATYMRRYIISHYNEPIDIASSSLSEKNAIYGGG